MDSQDNHLRVLTFNVWGLKYLSKKRLERIQAIGNRLKDAPYDIIGLQELWADYDLVRRALRHNFPYSKYWRTAALGSGLAVFSKFPIVDSSVFPYSLNGCPSDLAGDWFAGKAVVSAVIRHPVLGEVEIFNTHFFARGGEEGPEHWRAVRIANAWEMAKLVKRSVDGGRHVVVMGDFNSSPHSLPMKIMFSHANLIDTWTATHPPPPADPIGHNTHANAVAAMETFGLTVDTPLNTWSHGKPLDGFARRWLGKRLDYILYRSPAPKKAALSVQSTKIVMTDNVPGQNFSYSDHFGLEATFTVDLRGSVGHVGQANEPTVDASMKELSDEELLTALGALAFEYGSAKGRVQRHLACFGGCVAVLLLILLGSAWIKLDSRWAAPVATLLGAFVTWAGTTSLYVGLVYGRWETGILTNLMAEVEETRQRLPNAAHDM